MTSLVRVSGLRGYIALVDALGGNAKQLSMDCDVDHNILGDDEALIPYRQLIYLMEHSAKEMGVPDFGLQLAAAQDTGILGPLAVAIQNAPNVRDSLRCACDYIFVQSSALRLSFEETGEETRIGVEISLSNMPHWAMQQTEDLAIGLTNQICHLLTGDDYRLLRVDLPHAPLCSQDLYEKHFRAPVQFGCLTNSIYIPTALLEVELSAHSTQLYQQAVSYLDVQLPTPDCLVATSVETAIRRTLGTNSCNRDVIAKAMAMHPRTLHRRLERENITFDQIRDRVRRDKAEYYLCETNAPLAQVAAILGYAEQAVLSRNCRRWFGQTPRNIRASHSP